MADDDQHRPAAWSREAERAVLATMLQNPRTITEVGLLLRSEDFYSPSHQALYEAMVELAEGNELDPTMLATHFVTRGMARRVNSTVIIADLATDNTVVAANISHHALRIRELSRVRRFKEMFTRGLQVVEETERGWWESEDRQRPDLDLDRLQTQVASVLLQGEVLVDEKLEDQTIPGLMRFADFLSQPDDPQDWLVEGLFEREDVWMILGSEGGGKSYLSRQCVMCLGAGIHPFAWDEGQMIEPVNSLLIDLENAPSMVRRQARGTYVQAHSVGNQRSLNEFTHIWTKRDGLNLRDKADQLLFQAVIERIRPRFVALGSLYNSFVKGRDDWETAAEEVKVFFMRMKLRYGFTLLLEHHMPKGDGQNRPQTPYGSSVWQRWVTHGRTIVSLHEQLWGLEPFRNDRDPRRVPAGMTRGGMFPWSPVWTKDDLDARMEILVEVDNMRDRGNQERARGEHGGRREANNQNDRP